MIAYMEGLSSMNSTLIILCRWHDPVTSNGRVVLLYKINPQKIFIREDKALDDCFEEWRSKQRSSFSRIVSKPLLYLMSKHQMIEYSRDGKRCGGSDRIYLYSTITPYVTASTVNALIEWTARRSGK